MAKIYYHATGADWRKEQKYRFLDESGSVYGVEWTEIAPDAKHNWLTEGMRDEFETFISIANKEIKSASKGDFTTIFKVYSGGLKTNRNNWCFNFGKSQLKQNIEKTIRFFNEHITLWNSDENQAKIKKLRSQKMTLEQIIDQFVRNDDSQISWSGSLKSTISRGRVLAFDGSKVSHAIYTPFQDQYVYFDRSLNERTYQLPSVFPIDSPNQMICVTGIGSEKDFAPYLSDKLTNMSLYGGGTALQCFPFYTYNEDGTNRRENITDWALEQFREHYSNAERGVRNAKSKSKIQNRKVGHFLLHLRDTASPGLSREIRRESETRAAEDPVCTGVLVVCKGRERACRYSRQL